MIPPIVHRVWLDDPMPETFERFGQEWRDRSDLELRDWLSVAELPLQHFRRPAWVENAEELFPRDWKRFQADVVRLELLNLYGGLYIDTDVEPGPRAAHVGPELLEDVPGVEWAWAARSPQHNRGHHPITNCVMAATPGHPWIRKCIERLPISLASHGNRSLAQCIGPWHLTRIYEAGDWPTVSIHEWTDLEPYLEHHWNTARRKRGEGLG